jgi:hypothetical protein
MQYVAGFFFSALISFSSPRSCGISRLNDLLLNQDTVPCLCTCCVTRSVFHHCIHSLISHIISYHNTAQHTKRSDLRFHPSVFSIQHQSPTTPLNHSLAYNPTTPLPTQDDICTLSPTENGIYRVQKIQDRGPSGLASGPFPLPLPSRDVRS